MDLVAELIRVREALPPGDARLAVIESLLADRLAAGGVATPIPAERSAPAPRLPSQTPLPPAPIAPAAPPPARSPMPPRTADRPAPAAPLAETPPISVSCAQQLVDRLCRIDWVDRHGDMVTALSKVYDLSIQPMYGAELVIESANVPLQKLLRAQYVDDDGSLVTVYDRIGSSR